MIVLNGGPGIEINEAVLFPYDDRTLPFRYRLQIGLVEGLNPYKGHLVAMERGGPGTPDSRIIKYYGAVCEVEDELRLWYLARGDVGGEITPEQVCYAVSTDGLNWEKPELGLVEFNGSKRNNLLPFRGPGRAHLLLCAPRPGGPRSGAPIQDDYRGPPLLHHRLLQPRRDPLEGGAEQPDPQAQRHRAHRADQVQRLLSPQRAGRQRRHQESPGHLRLLGLRQLERRRGAGTAARPAPPTRRSTAATPASRCTSGPACGTGATSSSGSYGMWHGESNDRRFISMDLGFLVSNDALHFTEPIPDFRFIPAYEIEREGRDFPTLEQGQGFANVGDESLFWYSNWRGGDLNVARFPRDRLGYFEVVPDPRPNLLPSEDTHQLYWREHIGDRVPEYAEPHCISCPIDLKGATASVYVNAQGLSPQNSLTVEILNERMQPIPGYGRADCIPVAEEGLRTQVAWKGARYLEGIDSPVRVRINWEGERPGDVFLYAAYVAKDG